MAGPAKDDVQWQSLASIAEAVQGGVITASGLVGCCLKRIKATDSYHTVLALNPEAKARAAAIDKDVKAGKKVGRLAGVPFMAKDNFLTFNTATTAASKILGGFSAPYQATAVERLEAEGAILIAKTNLDEFAHGSSTENSAFGPTKNPYDPKKVPGGSSGGSAAAVALNQCAFALGSDTGGSIRLPASFCGVVGLKPTYGLVSRFGVIAMASSTDVVGTLTRSVEDAAYLLEIMSGADGFDSTLIPRDKNSYASAQATLKGKKIGLIKEHLGKGVEPVVRSRVRAVAKQLEAAGARVSEVSIPVDELALAVYYIVVPAEISSNLGRYDGVKYGHASAKAKNLGELYKLSRAEGFGDEPKRRVLTGTYVLSHGYYDAYYKQAQAVRTQLIEQYQKVFKEFDLLMGPTSPSLPFDIGARQDPLSMYLADVLTVAVNLTGDVAISIPIGKDGGLPIGLQLIAPQSRDRELLGLARAVEALELNNG